MGTIPNYLGAKYGSGGPDGDRFEPNPDEVHSSQLADCERQRFWKHKRSHDAGPSPYFELGRVFEVMYGAALAYEHDPSTNAMTLNKHPPWEVAEQAVRVVQDVNVEIELGGDLKIVGEADWVVFKSDTTIEKMILHEDGSRTAVVDGEKHDYNGGAIEKVVETKTKSDIDYVKSGGADKDHKYQVYPYMKALDCDGEIAYMERNDWSEHVVPLELDESIWMDCVIRAKSHSRNMHGDEVPPTTPLSTDDCYWCPYSDECEREGGSRWT